MPTSDREMHLKSSAGRPKGTCKNAVLPPSSADLVRESGNMAAQTAFNGAKIRWNCVSTFQSIKNS